MKNFIERIFKTKLVTRLKDELAGERQRSLQLLRDLTEAESSVKKYANMYIGQSHVIYNLETENAAKIQYYENQISALKAAKKKKA